MKCIFKGTDYEEIEEEANNLIMDLGLEQSQLNCFEVAFLLGIALRKYSEVPAYYRTFLMSKSEFGYSIRNEKQYVIYYNDALDKDRIRFSIWNEIAHIQLGHLESDCQGCRERLEDDANYFADYIMTCHNFSYKTSFFSNFNTFSTYAINFYAAYKQVNQCYSTIIRNSILYEKIARLGTGVS